MMWPVCSPLPHRVRGGLPVGIPSDFQRFALDTVRRVRLRSPAVQRLRELLAHGGIAILAVVLALALVLYDVALALSREIVSIVQQQTSDIDGGWTFDFTIGDTTISYADVLYLGVASLLIVLALYGTWLVTRRDARTCPECRSSIPAEATVCRYCTADLSPQAPPADA